MFYVCFNFVFTTDGMIINTMLYAAKWNDADYYFATAAQRHCIVCCLFVRHALLFLFLLLFI